MRRIVMIGAAAAAVVVWSASLANAATGWVLQATPNPGRAVAAVLTGVSCASATSCTSVGYSSNGLGLSVTLAEHWDGSKWAIQPTPSLKSVALSAVLTGVSCASVTRCTAAGYYINGYGQKVLVAERWNGTKWAIQTTPAPTGSSSAQLGGVSCASVTRCTATGEYVNSSGQTVPLAEQWNGHTWTIQATPNPAGAQAAYLSGVSCASAASCTAAGYYTDSTGQSVPLAEDWNGSTWTIQTTPNPTGSTLTVLSGVSCASATSCIAAGYYGTSSGLWATLAEYWNGSTWVMQATPNPTRTTTGAHLSGVSCASATNCTAAGYYPDSSGLMVTLAEHWNGSTWTIQATPKLTGSMAAQLSAVSCAPAAGCTAAGYNDGSYGRVTLAEHK